MRVLVGRPVSNDIETDSMRDAERPGSRSSGCLMGLAVREVIEREERIDWVSEAVSEAAVDLGVCLIGVRGGEEWTSKSGGLGIYIVFRTWLASLRPLVFRETVFCALSVCATFVKAASASSSSS